MVVTTFISDLAVKTVAEYAIKKGKEALFLNKTEFTKELEQVITDTISEFKEKCLIQPEGEKFPFYNSEILLKELLSIKLIDRDKIDTQELKNLLATNTNIITPQQSQVFIFLEIFEENCKKNLNLRQLQFNDNYREGIFAILKVVDEINSVLSKVVLEVNSKLRGEYWLQLGEIQQNINEFKSKTALSRIETLEVRIKQNGQFSQDIESKLLYLKGLCYLDCQDVIKGSEFIVKAYQASNDISLKAEAAIAYINLEDIQLATNLANELVISDRYNLLPWLVLIIADKVNYRTVLEQIPTSVKQRKGFVIAVIRYLNLFHKLPLSEICELGFSIPTELDENITRTSITIWNALLDVRLSEYFNQAKGYFFGLDGQVRYLSVDGLENMLPIFNRIFDTIHNTEVFEEYTQFRFYFNFVRHLLGDNSFDKNEFRNIYNKVKGKAFSYDLHYSHFSGNTISPNEALQIAEHSNFNEHDLLLLFRIYYNSILGNKTQSQALLKTHIDKLDVITYADISNLIKLYEMLAQDTQMLEDVHRNILNEKSFITPEIKRLYEILISIIYYEDTIDEKALIEELTILANKFSGDVDVSYQISQLLLGLKAYEQCAAILKPFKKDRAQTNINLTYCHSLLQSNNRRLELLKFLEEIRINNVNNSWDFLALEFNLRRDITDLDSMIDICWRGIRLYPHMEQFHLNLLISLDSKGEKEQISEYVTKYYKDNFSDERIGVGISTLLRRNGFYKEYAKLLFNLASNESNYQARTNYATFSAFPDGFILDYAAIENGSYVKLVDDKRGVKLLKAEITGYPNLIGKRIGDIVIMAEKIGVGVRKYAVKRVMNAEAFLIEKILEEAQNPNSELGMKALNFSKENNEFDISSFQNYFREQFSIEDKIRKESYIEQIQGYEKSQISFTQVCRRIFNDNLLECYQHLTSKLFIAIPAYYNSQLILREDEIFALDFTSLIVFSELELLHGIKVNTKYVVSPSLSIMLKNALNTLQYYPPQKITLAFLDDALRPISYPENYTADLINKYNRLLTFISTNCIEKVIEEKVNIIHNKTDDHEDILLNYAVDNAMFVTNLGYTLISNDFFLMTDFKITNAKQVSPENFLFRYYNNPLPNEVTDYFIQNHYAGTLVTKHVLIQEYKKKQSNLPNCFQTCLINLKYRITLSPTNIITSISFLKEIYLTDLSLDPDKDLLAQTIFVNLLDGFAQNRVTITLIRNKIYKEFELMGEALDRVQMAFEVALSAYNRT